MLAVIVRDVASHLVSMVKFYNAYANTSNYKTNLALLVRSKVTGTLLTTTNTGLNVTRMKHAEVNVVGPRKLPREKKSQALQLTPRTRLSV